MRKRIMLVLPLLITLAGLLLVSYPIVGNVCSYFHSTSTIDQYSADVNKLTKEEIEEAKANAQAYNESNSNNGHYDALNLGDVISYIDIPAINVYLPIYDNTKEDTLMKGVGHLENTSLPVGGKRTHCVLTAHSGLTTATMFTDLEDLKKGDIFKLHTLDEILTYEVDRIVVSLPELVTEYFTVSPEEDYVTLMTCTPTGVNTHRLLVRGHFIEKEIIELESSVPVTEPKDTSTVSELDYDRDDKIQLLGTMTVAGALTLIIVILIIIKRRKEKKSMPS